MVTRTRRSVKLDLRLSPEAKQKLVAAATIERRTLSDFVLESALARAAETLPDQDRFGLTASQWEAFMAALDAPPRDLPRTQRLFSEPSIFESDASR